LFPLEFRPRKPPDPPGFTPAARGKRLVILACELDSGKERRFTPETDPELPLRVAVRMSMGVPGLMEPFSYRGDGGWGWG